MTAPAELSSAIVWVALLALMMLRETNRGSLIRFRGAWSITPLLCGCGAGQMVPKQVTFRRAAQMLLLQTDGV